MMRRAILGLLLAAAIVPGSALPQTTGQTKLLTLRAGLLERELDLAKLPNAYFLLDMREKRLILKAGGTVLRQWEMGGVRAWGAPNEFKTLTLVTKSALNPPQRVEIKPGGAEETPAPAAAKEKEAAKKPQAGTPAAPPEFELEALELKDMPKSFEMVFEGGLRVSVKAAGQSLKSTLGRVWNAVRWSIGRPLEAVFAKVKKRPFLVLELTLREDKEVQALYWALFDGIKGLIWYTPVN